MRKDLSPTIAEQHCFPAYDYPMYYPLMYFTYRFGILVQHIRCPVCGLKVKAFGLQRALRKWKRAIDKHPASL